MLRMLPRLSRIEALFVLAFSLLLLSSLASLLGGGDPQTGDDYRDAMEIARSEIEALARMSPAELAMQLPPAERVVVIPGSLLGSRQSSGAISILGRRVAWDGTCTARAANPERACPGLYRRIERIDGALQVTIVVAWPAPEAESEEPLRRVEIQSRIG